VTDPFDPDALFKKAQLFVNRSFEASEVDQFDAAALWAGPRQSQVMPRISNDLDGSRAVQRMPAAMLV
jgi:hypothetical protein